MARDCAALLEFENVRGARRPLIAMVRGDHAAAAPFQPAIQAMSEIRASRAIQPGERLIQ
jgi:hypothetical protein